MKFIIFKVLLCCCIITCRGWNLFATEMILFDDSQKSVAMLGSQGEVISLTYDIDLDGRTVYLAKNVTIKSLGGIIKNGILVGADTIIEGTSTIFDKVKIQGTWNVKYITTDMFVDLNYDNSLRDVFALTDSRWQNYVNVEDGDYYVFLAKNMDVGIEINDNTNVLLKGNIILRANSFPVYYIINIVGKNVMLYGNGTIIGDKFSHTSLQGEWGMGLHISTARNVLIKDITVKNCWGDCIYIGDKCEEVQIIDCLLDNGRRQGISITSGKHVEIVGCVISNICGTPPSSGIDIETNHNCFISDVTIANCDISNCYYGIQLNGHAQNSVVTNVLVDSCSITDIIAQNIVCYNTNSSRFTKCYVDKEENYSIKIQDCQNVIYEELYFKNRIYNRLYRWIKLWLS